MKYERSSFTVPVCQYDDAHPKAADLDEVFGRKKRGTCARCGREYDLPEPRQSDSGFCSDACLNTR